MRTENLLIELGTEELPPKSLIQLGSSFAANVEDALNNAELSFTQAHWFAAPRRLAVYVVGLAEHQQDKIVEKRGPAVSAAFDDEGNPTKAAVGWARGNGISVEQAERLKTDKGEWLLYKAEVKGQPISALLQDIVNQAIAKLPISKPMRWGNYETQFIRPVHTLCTLFGSELIAVSALGMDSSRTIQGHRFHGDKTFELDHADNYLTALKSHYVVADFDTRASQIASSLNSKAEQLGLVADYDDSLLNEIAALVEWPVVLQASFDENFLNVPKEALIYTMKDDQKYVPLLNKDGSLSNQFLFVTNIESNDPIQIISGNERVIRPRLADAEFFFDTDKKHTLDSRRASLDTVLFQKQLGTLKDKSDRIARLSASIARTINADPAHAERAGLLSKTDLMTNMVMEFPDVQGVMGKYYALHDGEPEPVANALYEQYLPRFAGDELPSSLESAAVALADKFDTLVGIFGIGQLPKGDRDPFALRRAAIGVLRIITEKSLVIDLEEVVSEAVDIYADKLSNAQCNEQVVDFILGRFNALLQDQNVDTDVIQAVSARRPTQPTDYLARINAVAAFKENDASEALAAANKRVANILAKNNVAGDADISGSLLTEEAEIALYNDIEAIKGSILQHASEREYTEVLSQLATLRPSIDAFFDNVMVMADDDKVKQNRLALLLLLRSLFLTTADISLLAK
ncbi:glycine--tRNA ligase subunit beta [Alteromonas gilva]|uniref:Glycine--tRNA ligase beta subunit n=1 Tax=Alteromonas gilva TaxID=2987522 RepID=A0ABT5KWY4_9ALTE|nr:glycine--tRNA ligase subunit beta [Alteromonas gilva]MDC8829153.1 glycine--tRNA ligase subunit beta [Alteromonas gilva]